MRSSLGLFLAFLGVVLVMAPLGCSSSPTTSGPHGPGTSVSSEKKPDTPHDGSTSGRPPFKPGD